MRRTTSKALWRAACQMLPEGSGREAKRRVHRFLKRRWNGTPWNERAALRRKLRAL